MSPRLPSRKALASVEAQMRDLAVELRPVAELLPYAQNARLHSQAQVAKIAAAVRVFGWTNPVLISDDGGILAGHGRVLAAKRIGLDAVPCVALSHLSAVQRRAYVLADNRLAELSGWNEELREAELGFLRGLGPALGFSLEAVGLGEVAAVLLPVAGRKSEGVAGSLAARFLVAPFSVLDAGSDWWVSRRAAWASAGVG